MRARIFDVDLSTQLGADIMDFFKPLFICDWRIVEYSGFSGKGVSFAPIYELRSNHCDKFFRLNFSVCMDEGSFSSDITLMASGSVLSSVSVLETDARDPRAIEKLCQLLLDHILELSVKHRMAGPFRSKR